MMTLVARDPSLGALVEERSLLVQYASGDRSAAERLVADTYRQVFGFVLKLCGGDADLAADLTQDTYRKAWDALAGFDGRSRFSTWLCRIAYTTFLNHLRRPHLVVPIEDEAGVVEAEDPEPSPEEQARLSVSGERLRRAVMALPEPLRGAVTAHFWGGAEVTDLAREAGVTAVAIRKRIKKALAVLAAALEEDAR